MARTRPELPRPWTVQEFLEWERAQEERYEYVDGVIRMMVGGTLDHNIIAGNVFTALRQHLQGGLCRVFMEGVKVRSGSATMYPDVVVSCQPGAGTDDVVREPALVIEVLSRTTEGFDRGPKWQAYQELPSLKQFVLVSQTEIKIEVFEREAEGWRYRVVRGREAALSFSVGGGITLRDLYENTTVAAEAANTGARAPDPPTP
jgi:Uma2 family endonuclease